MKFDKESMEKMMGEGSGGGRVGKVQMWILRGLGCCNTYHNINTKFGFEM